MSKYIKFLAEGNVDEIGTKAANLKFIKATTNYEIPQTLVLTSSFYKKLLSENDIKDPLLYDWKNIPLPLELEKELLQTIKKVFGSKPLVIRSSASCEDSPLLSFAGQYSSFLNITGDKRILKAVKLCYASLFSRNAVIYSELSGLDLKNEYMAVAIQEVAKITRSGVMFTANPVTGNGDELLIEYGNGLGDKIVGGNIIPNLVRVDKKIIKKSNRAFLDDVVKMGLKIEKVFKSPQDIEWGYSKNGLYIFQSRPVTTLKARKIVTKNIEKNKNIGRGTPASQGTIIGRLKIVRSLKDYDNIKNEDIVMILDSPNIKLIENMEKIGGLIIPGGLLSHFAVMAREFNKPCLTKVVNFDYNLYKNKEIYMDAINGRLYLIH